MTIFTGSTYRSGFTSSCVQLLIGASSARPHHIWSTSASQYPTLPVGSTYDLPTATNSMYSVIVARCSAVGPSLLPALRPGTHFQTTFRPGIATKYFQSRTESSAVFILLAHQRIRGLTATMRYINLRLTLTLDAWDKLGARTPSMVHTHGSG